METKSAIRKRILAERAALLQSEWERGTQLITGRLAALPAFREARAVYTYVDAKNEVGTRALIEHCLALGKKTAVPKVMGRRMAFYEIAGLDELRPAAFGLLEPVGGREASDGDALFIVPGVAFDKECHRIGYGGGYYDRYLAARPRAKTIALAFSFQVLPEIPSEPHDLCPRMLITERETYRSGE